MLTAKEAGINAVDSFIVNTGNGSDSDILFATKRYDRKMIGNRSIDGLRIPNRLHQEDFAQAMGISAKDKYEKESKNYLKLMFDTIRANCADPISQQIILWKMICFNYLIGNTDAHIKNFALVYGENLKTISLAPAYDIVSTRIYNMSDEMSFYIGGELNIERMSRNTFASAAGECGLTERIALKSFDEVADSFENALKKSADYLYETGFKDVKEMSGNILKTGGFGKL